MNLLMERIRSVRVPLHLKDWKKAAAAVAIMVVSISIFVPPVAHIGNAGILKANDVFIRLTKHHCEQDGVRFVRIMAKDIRGNIVGASITDTKGLCSEPVLMEDVFPTDTIVHEYGDPVRGAFVQDLAEFADGDKGFRLADDTLEVEPILTGWAAKVYQALYGPLFALLGVIAIGLFIARVATWILYEMPKEKGADVRELYVSVRLIFPIVAAFVMMLAGLESLDRGARDFPFAMLTLATAPLWGALLSALEGSLLVTYIRSKSRGDQSG